MGEVNNRIRFGPFTADPNTGELRKNGVRVKLAGQPFAILVALLEKPGELVTREELRKRVWDEETYVDFAHGLSAAVNKLREALSDSAQQPRYIETLPRRGYRFIAALEPAELPSASEPVPSNLRFPSPDPPPPGLLPSADWQPDIRINRRFLPRAAAGLAILVLLAALGSKLLYDQFTTAEHERAEGGERLLKLAAEQSALVPPSIWRVDVAHAAEPTARARVVSSEGAIAGPQPSPDGRQLVYMAGQTESMDIWVSNLDGSGPKKLTSLARCGTPRWSPDSRWIAFDSDGRSRRSGIFVVSADGGPVRVLVDDGSDNMVPSWSRDGKWIYFASGRGFGEIENVWKVPLEGGQPAQLTHNGGFSAYESRDGQTVYYAKSRYENPEIWEMSTNGGPETRVSALLRPSTWANWALTDHGILFLTNYSENASTLEYFDFTSRGVRELGALPNASFWLSASEDGKSVWYSELTQEQARQVFRAGLN